MKYLLDSCSVLWLTHDQRKLSESARVAIAQPAVAVYLSAISAWELGIKVTKKKLTLPKPISEWFAEVCRRYEITEIPVTGVLAAKSTELPPLHADPFDRLLVATALEFGLVAVTPDISISQYPGIQTLW